MPSFGVLHNAITFIDIFLDKIKLILASSEVFRFLIYFVCVEKHKKYEKTYFEITNLYLIKEYYMYVDVTSINRWICYAYVCIYILVVDERKPRSNQTCIIILNSGVLYIAPIYKWQNSKYTFIYFFLVKTSFCKFVNLF